VQRGGHSGYWPEAVRLAGTTIGHVQLAWGISLLDRLRYRVSSDRYGSVIALANDSGLVTAADGAVLQDDPVLAADVVQTKKRQALRRPPTAQ
jgi:hypothetical protein